MLRYVWEFLLVAVVVVMGFEKIVYPKVYSIKHSQSYGGCKEAVLVDLGDWTVELNCEGNLLVGGNLKTEWIDANGGSRPKMMMGDDDEANSRQQCDYHTGMVRGFGGSSGAALAVCSGGTLITGYVNVGALTMLIECLNETTGAHVLYSVRGFKQNRPRRAVEFTETTLQQQHQWLFNLTGDTIDIGVAEDGGNREAAAVVTAPGNSSNLLMPEWHREQLDDEQNGYFYDSAWTAKTVYSRKQGSSPQPVRWLKIAVAVDFTVIAFHGRNKVEQYVLALMNIVSAIYQDPSLDTNLKLVITRLQLHEYKKHTVVRPGNAKKSLENVNMWNRNLHIGMGPGENHHDLAVWLTRSDIGGPSGYAPVAGVCDPKRSCTLNRDEGLSSAFIIAHETAHILGLSHDGDTKNGNTCGDKTEEGSVMAPMVSATFNKFFWSECSKNELQQSINQWACLLNVPSPNEIFLNATLQTTFTMDEQCRMEFGDGYVMCRTFDILEPCSHLWCGHIQSPAVCKTKKGPPLEGTECGFGRWCVNGYCEDIGQRRFQRIPVVLNPQDGGWSKWSPWGLCSRTCGIGIEFRSRKCNNPVPSYGGRVCEGSAEEWRPCNKFECPEPLADFRAEQCKRLPKLLNVIRKLETNISLLPFESNDEEKKCKYLCLNEETKLLYETEENLIDGTPCSYEQTDRICVQGKCQDIGCDGQINSHLTRDKCGICGGNNSLCSESSLTNQRKLKKEVSRIVALPRMAREIRVEVNVTKPPPNTTADVAFIIKNRRKKKFVFTIPNTSLYNNILEGTNFFYEKNDNHHRIRAKGPVLAEMIILVYASTSEIQAGLTVTITTQYSINKNYLVPSKRYVWIKGGFGPCSASCGGGRRQKTMACWDNQNNKMVRRKFCSLLQKPAAEVEKCNTFGCNFQWVAGEWEPCSTTCGSKGVQHRELYCVPKTVLTKILFESNSTFLTHPWKFMVSPNKCSGMSPSTMRFCNRNPCPAFWQYGNWSQCSTSCGSGITTRSATCPSPEEETTFDCGKPPPQQKKTCLGPLNRHSVLCKGHKKCRADQSLYCGLSLLARYCKISGFQRLCCKSCASVSLAPISD